MARYSLMVAALFGFLVTAAVENLMLPLLRRWQTYRISVQPILRRNKPEPPSMGGFAVILGTLAAVLMAWVGLTVLEPKLMDGFQRKILMIGMFTGFAFGMLGLWDDLRGYLRRDGHSVPTVLRITAELCLSLGFLAVMYQAQALPFGTILPFVGYVDLGIWFIPMAALTLTAFVECAHLSAGGMGVCSLNGFLACLACSLVAALQNHLQMALYATALAGALLAFLLWGFPPAKLLLGRSGSAFLSASVAVIAISMGWGGLLFLLGGIYWLEGIAHVLQGISYQVRKRPLVPLLPLQAAMTRAGWSENKIVGTMGLGSLMFTLLALVQIMSVKV